MPASWPEITPSTLAEQVYGAVRHRIVAGEIAPGEFLRERDLEGALGVSRTPIREALGRLASEGFLERIAHRGFRVPDEGVGGLLDLYPVVAALDLLAGQLALPRLGPDGLARLRAINEQLAAAMAVSDAARCVELNNAFHAVFGERSGNAQLHALLGELRPRLTRLERWYYMDRQHTQDSIEEHRRIIAAIEAGDHSQALRLLETNMALTQRRLADGQ